MRVSARANVYRVLVHDKPGDPAAPSPSTVFFSGFEISSHVFVHFRLIPAPSPATTRVQDYIAERIERESAQSLVALRISTVFQVAVPEMKDAPVDKSHIPAH